MGCGPSKPRAGPQDGSNALPGNNPAAALAAADDLDGSAPDHPNSTSARPNKSIRASSPLAKSPKRVSNMRPPWTRSHLQQQRDFFWETRAQGVGGRSEVWDALRSVCESLRHGDVLQAQAILDAANVNCPTGRVTRDQRSRRERERGGVYDESGRLYEIPDWVMTDPLDLVEDPEKESASDGAEDDDEESSSRPQSQEKGKGKGRAVSIGEEITVRARLSDRVQDVHVTIGEKQPARVATQKILEQTGVKKLKLLYMGRPIDESKTLESQGWIEGHIVNAFVFGESPRKSRQAPN